LGFHKANAASKKARKFNHFVAFLTEQTTARLTEVKHLLYIILNHNLCRLKTMWVVKQHRESLQLQEGRKVATGTA